ncbi:MULTISPECIES: outer membrane protein [Rhodopseudomonas]|uniref:Membrane protein n=1 Tax=Rhodopseudomonas palustris TaxID=1076 RepID=A0A0D7EQ21_RHOPL|nr:MULTISPECIES: outer membrane protein [Rhodopseudomonas]KIZ42914.1 membrane protein [Rhodopseudomonas palustris]MDF3810651.1 porin family protein [Rhodopseudomonas sp. BAL398]WOK18444.1 porin family protein [Rhodopseudomonas sp. BAL398]
MKKLLSGIAAAAAMFALAGPAAAADLGPRTYTKAPAYTAPEVVYNWTGFYLGGNLGGAFAGSDNIANDGRFMGGVQGGADFQFAHNWVVGIEAQYSWLPSSNNDGVLLPGGALVTQETKGLGSVTGRLGYTWGPALLYAKGGYAFRDSNLDVSVAGTPAAYSTNGNRDSGYTVGAGLEYMFAPNWSAKVEYQYYKFDDTNFTGGPAGLAGTSFRNDEHTVKAGLNYRFGWGGPEVAKY